MRCRCSIQRLVSTSLRTSHARLFSSVIREDIRNIAIVAHVDHGKTTLVDQLLRQSGALGEPINGDGGGIEIVGERVMDSNAIEKERGITILSKCTSFHYNNTKINLIDTPGHQDFGGEVERILTMIDGLLLVCDVNEGPMPQTRYILEKAFRKNMIPLICVNKLDRIDRSDIATLEMIDDTELALMETLDGIGYSSDAIDTMLSRIIYASGKTGFATDNLRMDPFPTDMTILLQTIIDYFDGPVIDDSPNAPFAMLGSLIDSDEFFGRYVIGRVSSGHLKVGNSIHSLSHSTDNEIARFNVDRLFTRRGTQRCEVSSVSAGDIIGIPCDAKSGGVFDTLCSIDHNTCLPIDDIDPPTLCIRILGNDSPMRGFEGDKVLFSDIVERLESEAAVNVCLKVKPCDGRTDMYEIYGRGELQLAILLETMRREGFEFAIAAPKVVTKIDAQTGVEMEPIEQITIDCAHQYTPEIIGALDKRGALLLDCNELHSKDTTRLRLNCSTRGLLGYEMTFKSCTRGSGRIYRSFDHYAPKQSHWKPEKKTFLLSVGTGKATQHALYGLEGRCKQMFVRPGDSIYEGMIFGEGNKHHDVEGNPTREKSVSNVREKHKESIVVLKEAYRLHLEEVLTTLLDDQLLEITPKSLRLRKTLLKGAERRRAKRKGQDVSV